MDSTDVQNQKLKEGLRQLRCRLESCNGPKRKFIQNSTNSTSAPRSDIGAQQANGRTDYCDL